ncbi:MAG TPA: SusC/RagA family TonB-linked outer membrane protein, partial [Chitinophagaceae bacterium]|nr:SusC/RagA family TonB-linked outer membrane protein [Chitinophagaceae bacterium]
MEKKCKPQLAAFAKKCTLFPLLFLSLFVLSLSTAHAQTGKVSGVITDEKGNGIEGVTVVIKGTTNGTTTDNTGKFSMTVPNPSSVLVFSSTGYTSREQVVGSSTVINISLTSASASLDEIVVVGYGTQRKRDVTGAISSVSSAQITQRQPTNVFDALQGQVAGVQIAQESGRPGASSSIRIRGTATLEGGADPLYIVDGAQGVNIDGINPADIESIEILKDGASAAIYGSRSANGVIIITTKKGREGRPKIDLRYLNSFSNLSRKVPQANAADRRLLDLKRSANGTISTPTDSLNPGYNADNDYQDLLTQTAIRNQVDLGISGATKALNYYASFGLLKDKGLIVNSWADIVRTRINVDYKPNDKFGFGTRIQGSYQRENRIDEGNTLGQAIQRPPNFRIYFQDGTLSNLIGGRRNPLAEALYRKNEFDIYSASIYNYAAFNFTKDLKFTVDANIRGTYQKNLQFAGRILSSATPANNELSEETELNTYWITQAYFNYNKTLKGAHAVTAVLGVSADQEFEHTTEQGGTNLVTESVLTLNSLQERTVSTT